MIFIILPIKNESKEVIKTARDILFWARRTIKEFQIIFVNDHSTNGIEESLRASGFNNLRVINNESCGGKGSALTFAFKYLRGEMKSSDVVMFLDGDGQIDISDASPFIKFMEIYNAQAVIGNKRHLYSITQYNLQRRVVSLGYNSLVKILFDIKFGDTQCGIKMFRVSALDKIINKLSITGFAFDVELLVALKESGIRIVDAPVRILDQRNKGSVSVESILKTFHDTILIFKKYKKSFYKK